MAADTARRTSAQEDAHEGSHGGGRSSNALIANAGMAAEVDVFFDENQVFRLLPEAETQGLRRLAWFASDAPLRSGWAWGQQHLKDGVTAFEAPIGRGRLLVFTPEITFRAQAQGTFRLLFNALVGEAP